MAGRAAREGRHIDVPHRRRALRIPFPTAGPRAAPSKSGGHQLAGTNNGWSPEPMPKATVPHRIQANTSRPNCGVFCSPTSFSSYYEKVRMEYAPCAIAVDSASNFDAPSSGSRIPTPCTDPLRGPLPTVLHLHRFLPPHDRWPWARSSVRTGPVQRRHLNCSLWMRREGPCFAPPHPRIHGSTTCNRCQRECTCSGRAPGAGCSPHVPCGLEPASWHSTPGPLGRRFPTIAFRAHAQA